MVIISVRVRIDQKLRVRIDQKLNNPNVTLIYIFIVNHFFVESLL